MIKTQLSSPSTPMPPSSSTDQIKSLLLLLILISKIQPSCFLPSTNHHSHYLPPSIFFSSLLHFQKLCQIKKFLFSFTKPPNFPSSSNFKGQHSQAISFHPLPYYSPSFQIVFSKFNSPSPFPFVSILKCQHLCDSKIKTFFSSHLPMNYFHFENNLKHLFFFTNQVAIQLKSLFTYLITTSKHSIKCPNKTFLSHTFSHGLSYISTPTFYRVMPLKLILHPRAKTFLNIN